jgi:hypothetical protein
MAVNQAASNKSSQKLKRTSSENTDLIDKWLKEGVDHSLSTVEEEEAFSDWWMENKNELRG